MTHEIIDQMPKTNRDRDWQCHLCGWTTFVPSGSWYTPNGNHYCQKFPQGIVLLHEMTEEEIVSHIEAGKPTHRTICQTYEG